MIKNDIFEWFSRFTFSINEKSNKNMEAYMNAVVLSPDPSTLFFP